MLYTIEESLKLLKIGRTKFYEELNAGHIKGIKVGTRTLIPQGSINDYLDSLPVYPNKGSVDKQLSHS